AASATFALTSARIAGLAAPATLAPNSPYTLTVITENYIQRVYDVSVAWGYVAAPGFPQSLGRDVGSSYLGPDKSNILTNISIETTAPAGLREAANAEGKVLLSAAVYSLYGALAQPTVANFNVTVQVGDQTST
ncbi:hypothetical protein K469DRAFT_540081, partial [Zopfia rhizophila CBS 207.26]